MLFNLISQKYLIYLQILNYINNIHLFYFLELTHPLQKQNIDLVYDLLEILNLGHTF